MYIKGCPNTKGGGDHSKKADKNFQDNYDLIDWGNNKNEEDNNNNSKKQEK